MFTTVAFMESQDLGGVLGNVAPVVDDHISVNGDFLTVPQLNNIIGVVPFVGASGSQAQLQSPSLRQFILEDIAPLILATVASTHANIEFDLDSPTQIQTNEGLEFLVKSDPTSPEYATGVLFLSDGPITPISGNIRTIKATASITGVNGEYKSGAISFSQTLPVGRYAVVGARVEMSNGVLARFIPVGSVARPGVIPVASPASLENKQFRRGGLGQWFEFDSQTPPKLEILVSDTSTSQDIYLDIIKL